MGLAGVRKAARLLSSAEDGAQVCQIGNSVTQSEKLSLNDAQTARTPLESCSLAVTEIA
jgi:hypothetical protein